MTARVLFIMALLVIAGIVALNAMHNYFPRTVKFSTPAIDETPDTKDPRNACEPLISRAHNFYKNYTCALRDARRVSVEDNFDRDCPNGATRAGCFSCTFECRMWVPERLRLPSF